MQYETKPIFYEFDEKEVEKEKHSLVQTLKLKYQKQRGGTVRDERMARVP